MVWSYVLVIRSVLMENYIEVQEDKFLFTALTKACKLNNDVVCARMPIHKGLLNMVLKETYNRYMRCNQPYLTVLYTCIFSTAYFGLFRISELARSPHAVKAIDVKIGINKRKMKFILRSSKLHGKYAHPQIIKILHNN